MDNLLLLAIDGSDGSNRALEYAKNYAELTNAKIVVCFVIEWSPYSFNTPEENAERHSRRESEIGRAMETVVNPAVHYLEKNNVFCDSVVSHGSPPQVILEYAKSHQAAQIVIGRRGQSGLKSLLFGSVAGSLIQIADVPVVVVP